jgi:hypothetical protein
MLFRNDKGELIEICRNKFISDKDYYNEILKVKNFSPPPKELSPNQKSTDKMINLLKQR